MKNTVITIVAVILSVGMAALCGYFFCTQSLVEGLELYALIPVYIITVVASAFIIEITHEGAHLIVGLCCSMGVKAAKIRIFKSSSVDVYPSGAKHMKARMIATACAGNVFTLLMLTLGVLALFVDAVPTLMCVLAPYALYSLIINVAPCEYGGGKTDGLIVWELITNKPTAQVLIAILKVQGLVHGGLLLSEVDESLLLDVPQLPEDDINFIILTQLRSEYYLAKGNDSLAYKYFLRYRELLVYLPSEYKNNVENA